MRAVRALSREAADEPMPAIDWDAVEEKLFAEMARGERPAQLAALTPPIAEKAGKGPSRVGSPWTAAFAAAATVALVATGGWDVKTRSSASDVARATAVNGVTLDGSLELGDVVASKGRPLVYEMPGVVTFTLAPRSRIQLVSASQAADSHGVVTIALAEGSVHAEVEPRPDGEAFAVEVERTRVAVHGTSFTVSREGERVVVEVAHGSVAVGPAGHPGATQGWLLVGPDQGSFSLDGARDAQWLAAPASSFDSTRAPGDGARSSSDRLAPGSSADDGTAKQAAAGSSFARSAHGAASRVAAARSRDDIAPAEALQAAAPKNASEVDAEETLAILRDVDACYERQVSSFGVSFSVRSSLTLSILPSGAIREGVFNPPLSPTLMTCARDAIMSARFAAGESARQVRVPVNLSRAP